MAQLQGKTAVILGAASAGNMAQVIAQRFAQEGANVMLSGRNEEELAKFSGEIGGSFAICDICDHQQVKKLAETAQAKFDSVDIAINATGWGLAKPLGHFTFPGCSPTYIHYLPPRAHWGQVGGSMLGEKS